MKLSAFTMVLNPEFWCFPYEEALRNWSELFDEIVVVDGGSNDGSLEKIRKISPKIKIVSLPWPWDFKQREFPLHYNCGLDNCTGEWAIKMDIDWLFHETDFEPLRRKLEWSDDRKIMGVAFQKLSMLNTAQFHNKGRMVLGVHTKFWKNKIKIGVVKNNEKKCDWTNPILVGDYKDGVPYGELIPNENIFSTGISFYNYDCFFRTKEKCTAWIERAAKAYVEETGYPLYGGNGGWEMWKGMMNMRREMIAPTKLKIKSHPKHIQEKMNNMTPDMWGMNNWNWKL